MTVTITRIEHFGWHAFVAYDGDTVKGAWTVPEGGSPSGWFDTGEEDPTGRTADYMEWVYAVNGGTPKLWVAHESAGVAYFLTGDPDVLGYAYIGKDGDPAWHDNPGLTDDPDAWTDQEQVFQVKARVMLTEAATLAPALTERG